MWLPLGNHCPVLSRLSDSHRDFEGTVALFLMFVGLSPALVEQRVMFAVLIVVVVLESMVHQAISQGVVIRLDLVQWLDRSLVVHCLQLVLVVRRQVYLLVLVEECHLDLVEEWHLDLLVRELVVQQVAQHQVVLMGLL